jgi:Flp pilus assembly protein TadG
MTAIGAAGTDTQAFDSPRNQKDVDQNSASASTRRPCLPVPTTGQAMVEFLLVAPLFFFLMFAVFDFGRLFLVQMEVENAVQEAGRYASTGNHLPDPNNPGQSLSRVNSIIATLQQASFGQQVTNVQTSSLLGGNGSAGGPGDTVTISVTSNLKLMTPIVASGFPNGTYTFISSATFKNEPFPASETK